MPVEERNYTASLENILTICRKGLLNFQAWYSNSKSGYLSKENHLKHRESFMYKGIHCSTIRIGGKNGKQTVWQ